MTRRSGRSNCATYGHRGEAIRVPYYTDGRDAEECDRDGNLTGRLLRTYGIKCHACGDRTSTTIPIEREP